MAKNLVIVESPAKVKTIKKFLGANYEVTASNGHVRDLPKSQLGVDVDNNYEPKYITIRGKGDVLANLRKEVKKADKIYLATDPDREGEAISWHLTKALKMDDKKVYRITFNEITKNAVKDSLKNAREIDMNLVDAQQARRILDRMVGYRISPLLWAKVKRGLSAGRVQSVALRIICDREEEIEAFVPEEYWTLEAKLKVKGEKNAILARYNGKIQNEQEANAIIADCKKETFRVEEVKKGERVRKAPLPFTTSTLQQEASKVLNFSTQKTMRLAQQLYEGVEIKGVGTIGLITYLRTDSTRVSEEAERSALEFITKNYGEKYVAGETAKKKSGAKIQDAHEAIRPTDLELLPSSLKESLGRDLLRLYQLIYKRFLASQMKPAVYETLSVKIGVGKAHNFIFSASKLSFDGYRCIYVQEDENAENEGVYNGNISEKSELTLENCEGKQHYTQPKPHYTEASLVRELEELGIGRPSTYAPTITTILGRRYIVKENKNIYVTELGQVVNTMMKDAFSSIVDVNFTANMEALLDGIAEGDISWNTVIANFYPDLDIAVKEAEKELGEVKVRDELSDEVCELCGRQMVIKYGPHGKFIGCPGFPECRNTKPFFEKTGVMCPKCGKDLVQKMTRKGRRYYGCMGAPNCDFMIWQRPSKEKCPTCGGMLLYKGNRLVCMDESCGYACAAKEE